MDFCIKAQVNEHETCTMKEFQGIYKSCEKIVIDEIKGFIAKDSEIHEMFDFDFEHDGAKDWENTWTTEVARIYKVLSVYKSVKEILNT